jgi:hypothetical protein
MYQKLFQRVALAGGLLASVLTNSQAQEKNTRFKAVCDSGELVANFKFCRITPPPVISIITKQGVMVIIGKPRFQCLETQTNSVKDLEPIADFFKSVGIDGKSELEEAEKAFSAPSKYCPNLAAF